jgi:hypothetical protein
LGKIMETIHRFIANSPDDLMHQACPCALPKGEGWSGLAGLLGLGASFRISGPEDRQAFRRRLLQQWCLAGDDEELAACFTTTRGSIQGENLTILVDLFRLRDLLEARARRGSSCGVPAEKPQGHRPAPHPEEP